MLTFSEFSGGGFSGKCVPGSFVRFLGLVGDGFRVVCPAYPPRSVSGLVWIIGPLICGTGHVSRVGDWVFGVFLHLLCFFSSRVFIFTLHFSMHLPCLPPSRVTWRWFFIHVFFPPLKATASFHVLRNLPASYLAVQRCGSGF